MNLQQLKKEYDEFKLEADLHHEGFRYPLSEYVEALEKKNAEMLEVMKILRDELKKEDSVITDTFWYSDYETMLDCVESIIKESGEII